MFVLCQRNVEAISQYPQPVQIINELFCTINTGKNEHQGPFKAWHVEYFNKLVPTDSSVYIITCHIAATIINSGPGGYCHVVIFRWSMTGQWSVCQVYCVTSADKTSPAMQGSLTPTWWGYQLTKTAQNGGPQAISEILHIKYRIVCCIETYLMHIYHMSKCSRCNWNRYIEGFCMWNVHFHINGLSPNITYVILMSWPLMAIFFLLLNYWLLSVQFSYYI